MQLILEMFEKFNIPVAKLNQFQIMLGYFCEKYTEEWWASLASSIFFKLCFIRWNTRFTYLFEFYAFGYIFWILAYCKFFTNHNYVVVILVLSWKMLGSFLRELVDSLDILDCSNMSSHLLSFGKEVGAGFYRIGISLPSTYSLSEEHHLLYVKVCAIHTELIVAQCFQ